MAYSSVMNCSMSLIVGSVCQGSLHNNECSGRDYLQSGYDGFTLLKHSRRTHTVLYRAVEGDCFIHVQYRHHRAIQCTSLALVGTSIRCSLAPHATSQRCPSELCIHEIRRSFVRRLLCREDVGRGAGDDVVVHRHRGLDTFLVCAL
jgi:hypothetical protein